MQVSPIGLPWYKPENFLMLKAMFFDGNVFQDSYTDWLTSAQIRFQRLACQGKQVVWADIDPIAFPQWCRSRGLRMDSQARRLYADIIAQQSLASDISADTFQ